MKSLLNKHNTFLHLGTENITLSGKNQSGADTGSDRSKLFSAADLWNIQRQTRYRVSRRFL